MNKFATLLVFLVAVGCTAILVAGEERLRRQTPTCDCDIVIGIPSGCKISRAAPSGYECQCRLSSDGVSCSGSAIPCYIGDSLCKNPSASLQSCLYAKGNCGGYSAPYGCSCRYRSGGCYIASPAPAYFACHCDYVGFWTCSGRPVVSPYCQTSISLFSCLYPGTSKNDCQIAVAGNITPDCDGY